MKKDRTEEDFIKLNSKEVLDAAQSLIAVSSILVAVCDQYANTGSLSVGAVIHAGNVVDNVIERLGLAELAIEQSSLPF